MLVLPHRLLLDSQTALLSWVNCSDAFYASTDLHLCSVIHPVGIESSNPISRSLKCCPRERERVRENNRITLHWAQQDVRQESDEEGAGNGNGGLIRIKIEEETEQ